MAHTSLSFPLDQRGLGAAGFLLAALPVLLLGLGGVEITHWLQVRQTLTLVMTQAARVGTTTQGRPKAIADTFERALRMLYPAPGAAERALRLRRQALGTPWHIEILSPTPEAFLDHADPALRGPRTTPEQALIRNDDQPQQHRRRLAQGWDAGRGPESGLTIYEANTLVMTLWWPHAPMLPILSAWVRAIAPLHPDPLSRKMMASGYLPFRRQVALAMQSHPAAWPDLPDGRIRHAQSRADASLPGMTEGSTTPPDDTTGASAGSSGPGSPGESTAPSTPTDPLDPELQDGLSPDTGDNSGDLSGGESETGHPPLANEDCAT